MTTRLIHFDLYTTSRASAARTACGDWHKINSAIVTRDVNAVTCPKCLDAMTNRVEAALEPPNPLDLQARYFKLCRRPGESDADLRHRLEAIALNP